MTLVTLSTAYDVFSRLNKKENPTQILKSFSLLTNVINLFKLSENEANSISAIHGIRSLSIISIILVHTYWFRVSSPFTDENTRNQFLQTKVSSAVSAAAISVDSFFVLSGALITRSILRELDR